MRILLFLFVFVLYLFATKMICDYFEVPDDWAWIVSVVIIIILSNFKKIIK